MINDQDAINSLNKVDKKGKTTGQKFADVAKKGAKIGAAVVGATAAAGGALLGMASKTAETTDRIDKMSQKIGLSREGFQEWDFIMSQSGMSVDQLQTGFKTLVTQVDQAVQGTGKGAESFKKLGVSVKDANGNVKDQETIFNESVVALQGMEDGTEKAKLANDLFGRSGAEMMPLLNGAAGSVDEMKQKAHDLGLVLDDETIDSGVVFTDTMDQVKRSLGALTTNVGAEVMPMVQSFLEWVLANMPTIQNVMSTAFDFIGKFVSVAVNIFNEFFMPAITTMYDWVIANMPMIRDTFEQVFNNIKEIWETTIKPTFEALMSVVKLVWDIFVMAFPYIWEVVKIAFDNIKNIWETILQPTIMFIVDIINFLVGVFRENMPVIESTFKNLVDAFKRYYEGFFKPTINAIAGIIGWLRDKFTEYILPLVSNVIGWFSRMALGISEKMSSAQDKVRDAVNKIKGFFDGIKKAKDTVLGIFSNIYNGIKDKIESARDAVKNAIDKIKGFFNFNFKWPKLKMPKFGISGSMNPVTWLKNGVPKLTVRWNAKGGIFDKPTIFNTAQGLQGVGEAGPEAIMPLSKLESMLNLNNEKKGNEVTVNVNIDTFNNESDKDINELAEKLAFETNRRLSGGGLGYV